MSQHLLVNGKLVVWRLLAVFWACGFVAFWAQSALLPVSAEFQIHPQGCSEASTGKGGLFRQEVALVSWVQVKAEVGFQPSMCVPLPWRQTPHLQLPGRQNLFPRFGKDVCPKRTVSTVGGSDYKSP